MKQFRSWAGLAALAFIAGCGGGSGGGSSPAPSPTPPSTPTPAADTTPSDFSFNTAVGAVRGQIIESEPVEISGFNTDASISISDGEYAINNSSFTSQSGTISPNDEVIVRLTAPSEFSQTASATLTIGGVSASFSVSNHDAVISLNNDVRHIVGGIDSFDRRKFITIHASNTENDWFDNNAASRNTANASPDLITEFLDGYDVYLGRDTGGMAFQLQQLSEDPSNPGFVDPAEATSNGGGVRFNYTSLTTDRAIKSRQHEDRNIDMIVGAQQHPYWPDGTTNQQGFAFSTADTIAEPFGTATGDYMAKYLTEYFNRGPSDPFGQPKPKFVEVMNEPLYDLVTAASVPEDINKIFEFHSTIANEIRKTNSDVQIGGYTAAFPDLDKDNFDRWIERDKAFLDIAGADMDFISLHLYDFPAFTRNGVLRQEYRKGSNVEATFDMYEHYMQLQFGNPKPFIISEYGAQVHSLLNFPWSPERDWEKLKATNSLLMSFMERPDLIAKTIPFIVLKAEWGRISDSIPYQSRLMRQANEDNSSTSDEWVYTDLVKFYQLWSEVKGTRLDSHSTDPDFLVDAYADGNTTYIIINSLELEDKNVTLANLGLDTQNIQSFEIKHLYAENNIPTLNTTSGSQLPDVINIGAEGTVILSIEYDSPVAIDETSEETKIYADTMFHPILANQNIPFNLDGVSTSLTGEAILRLGIGRSHSLSLSPTITINGTEISMPSDFRGYDQDLDGSGRVNFFGVLEIPIPNDLIATNNNVTINFDDDGGYVSSVSLQYYENSRLIEREN